MTSLLQPAPVRLPDRCTLRKTALKKQLARFPRGNRKVIEAAALRHPALADLALTFPGLLFVIAVAHAQYDSSLLARMVIQGRSLKEVARSAGLPLWLKKLPPEAFSKHFGILPSHEFFGRQVANFLPKVCKDAGAWLECVAFAASMGTEAFAVWVARKLSADPKCLNAGLLARLSLWAWHSENQSALAGDYLDQRWHPAIDLKAADEAAEDWLTSLSLVLYLGDGAVARWLTRSHFGGFEFIPLLTARDVHAESVAMRNCLRGFGYDLASDTHQLISVRQDGKRIATFSLSGRSGLLFASVVELKARDNNWPSRDVALAVQGWIRSFSLAELVRPEPKENDPMIKRDVWLSLWRHYWLAKRKQVKWLPMAVTDSAFSDLRWKS